MKHFFPVNRKKDFLTGKRLSDRKSWVSICNPYWANMAIYTTVWSPNPTIPNVKCPCRVAQARPARI